MINDFFSKRTVVLAHRGDSKRFPENTMPAFISAWEMGVDVIETDIHLSADGRVIIWHDPDLSRITGLRGKIEDFTWDELSKVDAGANFSRDGGRTFPFRGKGIKMVLFREVLRELPEARFNVDLKDENPDLVDKFASILEEEKAVNRVIGASFHHKILKLLRKRLPSLITSFSSKEVKIILLQKILRLLRFRRKYPGQVLQVPERSGKLAVVDPLLLKTVHKAGLKVQVWTVNEAPDMKRLLSMGIDGIFTDDPLLLLREFKA